MVWPPNIDATAMAVTVAVNQGKFESRVLIANNEPMPTTTVSDSMITGSGPKNRPKSSGQTTAQTMLRLTKAATIQRSALANAPTSDHVVTASFASPTRKK